MRPLIRRVAAIAALTVAAGALASCASGPVPGSAQDGGYENGNIETLDRGGRKVRMTPRSAILVAFRSWRRKNYGNAIRLASHAIKSGRLQPRGLSLAYYVRGLAHHSTNRYSAATADYTAAVKNDPTNHLAYHSRGLVRSIQNDHLGAIADLSAAIRIRPTFTSHYIRGLVNLRLRRIDEAYSDASTVLSMRPNRYHGYYLRGLARHFRGQSQLAAGDYRRVLKINPRHKGAQRALRIVGRRPQGPPFAPRQNPDVRLLPISATSAH